MGEPAPNLEPEDQQRRRLTGKLRLVSSPPEIDEGERWVLEAIMACYCTFCSQS